MKFFAQGIRIVTSPNQPYTNANFQQPQGNDPNNPNNNNPNNPNNNNPNNNQPSIPSDLEVATQGGVVAGQPVLMVPYEMILTGTKSREELGPVPLAEESLNEDLPSFYLMLKLLKECERGSNSVWYHWLDSLPWWFANGSSLMEPCYELLPKVVAHWVRQEHTRFRMFRKAIDHADCLAPRIRGDPALVHWAYCIVCTRSVPLHSPRLSYTDVQLIPNADMFNHSHESLAAIELQTDAESGNCLAVATRNVPAGHPLRRCYGKKNVSQLTARYGFVDEQSPVLPCLFVIDNPSQEVGWMGYHPSKMVLYKDTGDVPKEVWDVLLYHVVLDQNTSGRADDANSGKNRNWDKQAFLEAVCQGPDKKKINAMHSKYYSETTQVLRNHVESRLQELEPLLLKLQMATSEAATNPETVDPRYFMVTRHNLLLQNVFLRTQALLLNQKTSPGWK